MKIPESSPSPPGAAEAATRIESPHASPTHATSPAGSDEASISTVGSAAKHILEASDSRIEELRKTYLEDGYQPDAGALSSAIVKEHLAE